MAVIGVDIAKRSFDLAVLQSNGKAPDQGQAEQRSVRLRGLCDWLQHMPSQALGS